MPCTEAAAVPALALLARFESTIVEIFEDTPGTRLASRVAGIGRAMSNVVREVEFDPPLVQYSRRGRAFWNRVPRATLDVDAWKAQVEAAEQFAAPTVRSRAWMADSNAALLDWLRHHRYLRPVDVADGESGMALLILWEVDHGCTFPSHGATGSSAALVGFTRRLKSRVKRDAVGLLGDSACIGAWTTCRSPHALVSEGGATPSR